MNREIAGCARINKKLVLVANLTNGKINPLIGAAGISAYPMTDRMVQVEGRTYDDKN